MTTSSNNTTTSNRLALIAIAIAAAACGGAMASCKTETPSRVVAENVFPVSPDPPHATIVYRVWWNTTYFPDPIAPSESSAEERTVPATDFAYAITAPGWDPASGTPPTVLVPLKSRTALSVKRGDTLYISLSNATFTGSCDTEPLTQEDADFITKRIFPADFTGFHYDAKTCALVPETPPDEAGAEEPNVDAGAADAPDAD